MADPFRRNRGDNEKDDDSPRIVFANLNRLDRPLLTEKTYRVFSGTAVSAWMMLVFFVWIFRVQIKLTEALISDLAASSVELSALSLAVLAIFHELNKKQKWFKLGLLLVALLFAGVVFGGFFLALTWQATFSDPQQITVVVVIVLGLIAVLQLDWKVAFKRARAAANDGSEPKVIAAIRLTGLVIPFFLPVVLVWLPGLNRLTGVIFVFAGALLTLISLMVVTTISVIRFKESEQEDPFLAALRARYERETKWLVRIGELREIVINSLQSLEPEKRNAAKHPPDNEPEVDPEMINIKEIIERMRQRGVTESKSVLDRVISSLVDEGRICREGYADSYWRMPDEDVYRQSVAQLEKLALVVSGIDRYSETEFVVENLRFTNLRNLLAVKLELPKFVVGEYILPRLLKLLRDEEHFYLFRNDNYSIFINRRASISRGDWEQFLEKAQVEAEFQQRLGTSSYFYSYSKDDLFKRSVWHWLLREVPHTDDGVNLGLDQKDLKLVGSFLPTRTEAVT